jgi:hypothetical protein
MKFIIKIRSFVDLITNSSTEIFMTVKGEEDAIWNAIKETMKELGCDDCVEFDVKECYTDDYEEKLIKGQYEITYDYECHATPCNIMDKKIREKLNKLFTIIEE